MFGFDIQGVFIGLVFVYLALSLFCSGINEGLSHLPALRAVNLKESLEKLLENPQLVEDIYNHPTINPHFSQVSTAIAYP